MKTNINNIRKNACQLILFYRSMYMQCHDNLIIVTDDVINNMHDHYIMLRGIYNCRLISRDAIDRAYNMYITILLFMKVGENSVNRI